MDVTSKKTRKIITLNLHTSMTQRYCQYMSSYSLYSKQYPERYNEIGIVEAKRDGKRTTSNRDNSFCLRKSKENLSKTF